jgi:hypothetical protein
VCCRRKLVAALVDDHVTGRRGSFWLLYELAAYQWILNWLLLGPLDHPLQLALLEGVR